MTTLGQVPPEPKTVEDPYPNKAIATAATALATFGLQWAVSGEFSLDQEGITVVGGAAATVLVWFVSNWKKLGGSRGDTAPTVLSTSPSRSSTARTARASARATTTAWSTCAGPTSSRCGASTGA